MSIDLILIGDSIRMGYQDTVRERLSSFRLWSPEANGGDSANVRAHLDEWVLDRSPRLVHLNCGLHDLKKPFDSPQAQVSLSDYRDNVSHIFDRILDSGAQLMWASTTPVDEQLHHRNKGFDRFAADVTSYNEVAAELASARDVPIDDLYSTMEQAGTARYLRDDGVHFSDEGSALLGNAVADRVEPLLT